MLQPYNPRLTPPLATDLNWIHYTKGGYNRCILINGDSVLPNCVGYAWGRWSEILALALGFTRHQLSTGNAEDWFGKNDGYARGQEPKLGAIICWRKGQVGVDSDGAGHLAVVEDILTDGSIIISNSNYLGTRFFMRTIAPPYSIGTAFNFQGFIYLPVEFAPDNKVGMKSIDLVAKEVVDGLWGNGADRRGRLLGAGYDPVVIQNKVNELLMKDIVVALKSTDEIAREVIAGKWGTGVSRRANLIKAGYNYTIIQDRVNYLLAPVSANKSVDEIAREVIAGKWGVGMARKAALGKAGYDYNAVQNRVNQLVK